MGVASTVLQLEQVTTFVEWLKTVVIWKQPVHLTSMKKLFGVCTSLLSLCFCTWQ